MSSEERHGDKFLPPQVTSAIRLLPLIPHLRHWLNLASLLAAAAFCATMAAVPSMFKMNFPPLVYWGIPLFTFFAWYAAAKQSQLAEAQAISAAKMAQDIIALKARDFATTPEDFKALTNSSLRDVAFFIAGRLRQLEAQVDTQTRHEMSQTHLAERAAKSQEMRNFHWYNSIAQTMMSRAKLSEIFKVDFQARSLALRNELLRRLGRQVTAKGKAQSSEYEITALDDHLLAGVAPLGELASLLETLADELP